MNKIIRMCVIAGVLLGIQAGIAFGVEDDEKRLTEHRPSIMKGGCHCRDVRYETTGEAITHALCHCSDCRRHAGAQMVGWGMFSESQVRVTKGETKTYKSSEHGRREFCPNCGTGLFYRNAKTLPDLIDIQTGTLDDPNQFPAQFHIQTAERISWMSGINKLPEFERYPLQK